MPPMVYRSPDRAETAAYLRAVAQASPLPIMLYNNPISYGHDIPPEMLVELGDEPRFVAVKESSGDPRRITDILRTFLSESSARTAMIVDRTGQLVSTVGEPPTFDPTAFASLTAADFSANDQLARMLGEPEFGALFHQGERESMYLADVARRVILVVLFDNRTTLGLVKLRVKAAVGQLNQVFTDMFNRDGTSAPGVESAFLGEAEDEIDKLFGS